MMQKTNNNLHMLVTLTCSRINTTIVEHKRRNLPQNG